MSITTTIDEDMKKFWDEIGLVLIYESTGNVIVGRIIDVSSTVITMRDLNGLRHWISQDSVARIQELGEGKPLA